MKIAEVWIDANAVIYFLTGSPEGPANTVKEALEAATKGDLRLRLASLTLAEVVWILESSFQLARDTITPILLDLIALEGVTPDEPEVLAEALLDYRDAGVDFFDAYLAAHARKAGSPTVLTFDHHFDRLRVRPFP